MRNPSAPVSNSAGIFASSSVVTWLLPLGFMPIGTAGIVEAKARVDKRRSLPPASLRRLIRVTAGVSQQAVADAVGVSRPAIAAYEAGTRTPSGKHLDLYVDALRALTEGQVS